MSDCRWCQWRSRALRAGEVAGDELGGVGPAQAMSTPRRFVFIPDSVGECHEDHSCLSEESRVCSQACVPMSSVVVSLRPRFCLFLPFSSSIGFIPCSPAPQSQTCHLLAALGVLASAFPSILSSVIKGTSLCSGLIGPRRCVWPSGLPAVFPLPSPQRHFLPLRFTRLQPPLSAQRFKILRSPFALFLY